MARSTPRDSWQTAFVGWRSCHKSGKRLVRCSPQQTHTQSTCHIDCITFAWTHISAFASVGNSGLLLDARQTGASSSASGSLVWEALSAMRRREERGDWGRSRGPVEKGQNEMRERKDKGGKRSGYLVVEGRCCLLSLSRAQRNQRNQDAGERASKAELSRRMSSRTLTSEEGRIDHLPFVCHSDGCQINGLDVGKISDLALARPPLMPSVDSSLRTSDPRPQ